MSDRRLTCPHRHLDFTDGAYRLSCPDCGQLWVTVLPGDDTHPDASVVRRQSPPPLDLTGLEATEAKLQATERDLDLMSQDRDGWKKGVEDANKISQRERERAEKAEAGLVKVALLEKVAEAARWFSENVYPPIVWKPEEVPADSEMPEGEAWAKRLNARLAALDGKKKAP